MFRKNPLPFESSALLSADAYNSVTRISEGKSVRVIVPRRLKTFKGQFFDRPGIAEDFL